MEMVEFGIEELDEISVTPGASGKVSVTSTLLEIEGP